MSPPKKKEAPEKKEAWTQVAVRLPESVLGRLEKLIERISQPGMRATTVDAIRVAMYRGLDELEAESKKKGA